MARSWIWPNILKSTEEDEFGEQQTGIDYSVGPELNIGRLITNPRVGMRSDLAIVAHSHPLTYAHRKNPWNMLMPSARDLLSFADQVAPNESLIGGIVATHSGLGGTAVRMWRSGEDFVPQRLQTLEPRVNIQGSTLATLGLRVATIVYSRRSGRLRSGLESLANLYPYDCPCSHSK